MRQPIDLDGSVMDTLVLLSEGNPGAATVLAKLIEHDERGPEYGYLDVLRLDDYNMRGPQIWVGYKYHCDHDLKRFVQCIRSHDPAMIAKVNEMCGGEELAR